MRRVNVKGTSGSGKSTFGAELARRLDVPYIELDALHKFDLWFGHLFPFNRLGWNLVIEGVRSSVSGM